MVSSTTIAIQSSSPAMVSAKKNRTAQKMMLTSSEPSRTGFAQGQPRWTPMKHNRRNPRKLTVQASIPPDEASEDVESGLVGQQRVGRDLDCSEV